MTVAWVIGAGGMLGSAVCRALAHTPTQLFESAVRINWSNEIESTRQLQANASEFAAMVQSRGSKWQIYWVAGLGTMGSTRAEMAREAGQLKTLLAAIDQQLPLVDRSGCLLLASSAGAIYAGSHVELITEATAAAPTTEYARGKLDHERQLQEFAGRRPDVAVAIARISTVYGPRPLAGKRQGLIAEMAYRVIRNEPIHIYVPLDTIRDYIAVDDAADALVALMGSLSGKSGVLMKIIASEQSTTISEITAIFKKTAHRMPRIVTSGCELTSLYRHRIQFRSIVSEAGAFRPRTPLVVGIAQVMASARLELARAGAAQSVTTAAGKVAQRVDSKG